MSDLRPSDFAAYFETVYGTQPFPWQVRLLRQVVDEGWPEVLDLPTGTGKTAAIDVALFHLALEAGKPARRAPVRIVVVVDRRTVVDQAYDRALRIADALKGTNPPSPVLRRMAERLALLTGQDDEPVAVAVLRGGIVRQDRWARSPAQPLVAVSTVDQVGSRLLFRGYGVSSSMRPIHAGLLGNDTLFLLDEVHLSEPFRQTLTAISERYRGWAERILPDRWRVVSMSATPSLSGKRRFELDDDDRTHLVLRKRLDAKKPVRLVEVKVTGDPVARVRRFAEHLAEAAAPPSDVPGAVIAVVVNRVRTARVLYELLNDRFGNEAVVHLITGRMRPFDRAEREGEIKPRVGAGRSPRVPPDGKPTIVVATQCLEAGADLDFDVMVTEAASLDALTQRFGRLNRLGEAAECRGVILARADQLAEGDDPVYGTALANTWRYLKERGDTIDFGVGLKVPAKVVGTLVVARADAPILLPAHLDTWVQTSQVPEPDPEIALWLHGPARNEPEVQIVWRADIDEGTLETALRGEGSEATEALNRILDRIDICPPRPGEALSVPISAARRWLLHGPGHAISSDDVADVEGVPSSAPADDDGTAAPRSALAWRGDRSMVVDPAASRAAIQPGDTLIVPSKYGGLAQGTWAPDSQETVPDIGDQVAYTSRRGLVLRLHPHVWRADVGRTPAALPPRPTEDGVVEEDDNVIDRWLGEVASADLPSWLEEIVGRLAPRRRRRIVRLAGPFDLPSGDGTVSSWPSYYAVVARDTGEATMDEEVSSFTGVSMPLSDHLDGVGAFARAFAEACGLPDPLVAALEMAGQWHDAGKADRRFQVMLHGGSTFAAEVAATLLAKSALPSSHGRARRDAQVRAGYPRGCRHELMSLALMLQTPDAWSKSGEIDVDLVFHLVASHHGWCRPLAPVAPDTSPVDVVFEHFGTRLAARSDHGLDRLDSGVSDRFFRLVRRYGWFGLAWLEAILRLADHRRSEWEQKTKSAGASA